MRQQRGGEAINRNMAVQLRGLCGTRDALSVLAGGRAWELLHESGRTPLPPTPRPFVACPISSVGEEYWSLLLFLLPELGARPRAPPFFFFSFLCMIVRAAVKCLTDNVENAHTFVHESSGAAQTRPCTEGEGVGID